MNGITFKGADFELKGNTGSVETLNNEDVLKNEDGHKTKDNFKNKDNIKNKDYFLK